MSMFVLCDVMSCGLLGRYWRFGWTYSLHPQGPKDVHIAICRHHYLHTSQFTAISRSALAWCGNFCEGFTKLKKGRWGMRALCGPSLFTSLHESHSVELPVLCTALSNLQLASWWGWGFCSDRSCSPGFLREVTTSINFLSWAVRS